MLELPYRVTTWSIFLFLICLIVIISLEVGRPTLWSILCGIIDAIMLWFVYSRKVSVTDDNITIHRLWKKKQQTFSHHATILIYKGYIVLEEDKRRQTIYLTQKNEAVLTQQLAHHHWKTLPKVEN